MAVRNPDPCMERQPIDAPSEDGESLVGWYCSLQRGHKSRTHLAYHDHDMQDRILARWVTPDV